ncbi:MAG: hypothetical protein K8Q97_02055 [Candidatus Andersenbacteria bacterium]|nr:hypothetical protein [Candidatus Andersenbacteria bacterium]
MKRSKNKQKNTKQVWMVGTALALAAVAIFLVTFYSGSLSLTAYHDNRPITQAKITTKLDCSFADGKVRATVSAPGMTLSAEQLNSLRIVWSTNSSVGFVNPTIAITNNAGVAESRYIVRSDGGSSTVRADFLGGWVRSGSGWMKLGSLRYYTPSSCNVSITLPHTGDPTPSPTITPISDPTPRPTFCPNVCRKVGNAWKCGC